MKIYNKIVIQIESGEVLFEDSYIYNGEVVECKGGGSTSTTSIDYAYNSRMAGVAEQQQGMAKEYFDYWKTNQQPLETAQSKAAMELLPGQTQLMKSQMESQQSLLPQQTNVAKSYYDQVLGGVNTGERMGAARADVQQATRLTEGERRRDFARMGVDPSSPAFANMRSKDQMNKTKLMVGASTTARRNAELEQMNRLTNAAATL